MRPRTLTLTCHAEARSCERRISMDEILRVVKDGQRRDCGECVLHYDMRADIGVVVNWKRMEIVTVYRLNNYTRWRLHNGLPLDREPL